MPEVKELKEFETALLKHLTDIDNDKAGLRKVSSAIVNLKRNGLVIDQVLVKGKPRLDRVIINGEIDPDFWVKIGNLGANFRRLEIFPKGIIEAKGFKFKGTIGL